MKRTYPTQIGFIISEAMNAAGMGAQLHEQRASAAWIDVVGPTINRYTLRRFVDRGVLHVYLSSAALKQELSFRRERLAEALNRAIGKEGVIKEVVIH